MNIKSAREITLASTSPYRRQLIAKLGLPFKAIAPDFIEESCNCRGVEPEVVAATLAYRKAASMMSTGAPGIIVGSDQVFVLEGKEIVQKPKTAEAAIEQLMGMQGKSHLFHTGVAVIDIERDEFLCDVETIEIGLKKLTLQQVKAYVMRDNPVGCAGAIKVESFGFALMDKVRCDDQSALIGLPLIKLVRMLEYFDVTVIKE